MRTVLRWMLASVWLSCACVAAQAPVGSAMGATSAAASVAKSGASVPSAVQATLPGVGAPVAAHADTPMSAAVQARWDHIAAELRCLVCQNESLASSNAELAVDLRRELRGLIELGQSDADIRSFLVRRYGDFVLYKPEVKPVTWLLWFGPFALLLCALVLALRLMRRKAAAPAPLTDSERARVRQLLES
jgi:cytochrome c-type biogenesis protein CcmH